MTNIKLIKRKNEVGSIRNEKKSFREAKEEHLKALKIGKLLRAGN